MWSAPSSSIVRSSSPTSSSVDARSVGVELTGDRDAGRVSAGARRNGVIVRASGQKIVMSPPLVIERDQLDFLADVLRAELEQL